MIKISGILRKVCACGFASLLLQCVWAATPMVYWDGDFGTTSKTVGNDTYTLTVNSNTVAADGSTITIADTERKGVYINWNTTTDAATILVKYSGLTATDKTYPMGLIGFSKSGQDNIDGLAVHTSSRNVKAYWGGAYAYSMTNPEPTLTMDGSVTKLALKYSNGGTHSRVSYDGGDWSDLYTRNNIMGQNSYSMIGAVIGGSRALSYNGTDLQVAKGMRITGIAIFNSVLSDEDISGFYFPSEYVAKIGEDGYGTLASAITAAGSDETTITLIKSVSENVTIPANVTVETQSATALSGTLDGSGKIKVAALAENTPRFTFADTWSGTVEIAALTQGNTRTQLMDWGTAKSKIVYKGLSGSAIWVGSNPIKTTIQLDGAVEINNGSSAASYTLNTVTGSGNLTLTSWGGCRNGNPYGVTYTINTLSDYTGTLSLENRSTYATGGAFKFAIGNIVKTTAPAHGEKILSMTRTCTSTNQQLDYDVSSTKLNGETAPLVLKDDGVYLASAMIGETPYATLQDAVDAAENAQTITIIGDVSSEKVAIENKVIYISGAINGRNVDCECEVPMTNDDKLFGDLEMAVAEVTSRGYGPFVVKSSVLFKMHKGVKIESDIELPPYGNTNSAIYFDATYCGMAEQTLDLNGHTISQTQGGPGGYWWSSVHVNCATVRIIDTSKEQTGKITGIGSCITINGYDEYQGYSLPARVTLESGTLTVTGKPQKSGSNTYYAENGIVGIFNSGKFIMTGGKIDAVADLDPEGKIAGVIADGANTTYGMPSVTITGGEIVGVPLDHLIQRKPGIPLSTDGLFAGAIVSEDMITISGGTFSTPIKPEYCADDYYPTVINGGYGVCTNPVAQIGDLYFLTYAEAVAVAKAAIASATDKDAIIDAIVANTIVAIKAPTEKIVVDNDVAIFFDFSADTYYVANNATETKREALYKKYFDVQCAMSFGYNSSVNPRPSVTLVGGGEAILDAMIDTEKRVNKHAKANYYHMIYTYKNIKFTKDWETPVYGNIGIVFSTRAGTEASPVVVDLNGHTLLQGKAIGNPSGMRIWQADSGYTKMIDSTADESNGFIGNGWLIGDQNTIAVQNGATFVLESGNVSIRGSYYKKPLKDSKGVVYDYELDAHIVAVVLGGKFIMNGGRLTWKGMDDPSIGILAEHVNVYQANAVINGGTIDVIPSDICNRAEKYYWCDDDGSGEPYPYGPYKAISGVSIYWYAEAGVSYGKDIKFVNQVARVGNTYYEDIDAAFEAAYESEDKEITLLHSVDYDKDGNVAGIYNYDAEIVLAASVEKFTVETTYMYYDAKVTSEVSTKGVIGRPRYETKKDTILKHDFDYDWVDYSTCEQVVVDTEHKDTQEALPAPISVETATLEAKKGLVPGLAEKQISEMTATEKQEILEAKEGNGLKVWENIVLGLNGTKHFEVATESESTRYGEVLDLSVPKSELLNTGFEVAYQVIFSNPDAGIEPAIYAYGSTIYLEQPSINPTGLYQVQAIIISGDPNMKPIAINTQNQIGVIKNADEVTEPKTIAVAVPFTGATVENLVNTKLLSEGDELKAYIDGAYAMWSLDENGKWVSKQTVRAGGTETAPDAETTELKRGTAVWVTTAGQVVTLGSFDAETEIVAADEKVNLLGNPTMTALEPAAKKVGDSVVLMDNTRYTSYGTTANKVWVTMQADKDDPTVVRPVEQNPSVGVGKGYWMIRK